MTVLGKCQVFLKTRSVYYLATCCFEVLYLPARPKQRSQVAILWHFSLHTRSMSLTEQAQRIRHKVTWTDRVAFEEPLILLQMPNWQSKIATVTGARGGFRPPWTLQTTCRGLVIVIVHGESKAKAPCCAPCKGLESRLAQRGSGSPSWGSGLSGRIIKNPGTGSIFKGWQQFRKVINDVSQVDGLHGPSASIWPCVPSALVAPR